MQTKIIAIAAMSANRVIGKGNGLPWKLSQDQKRFAALTKGHAVLMGRNTYESLPERYRPLPGRLNIVASRGTSLYRGEPGILLTTSPLQFLKRIQTGTISVPKGILWIIGGELLYRETISFWEEIYLTRITAEYDGDAYFPRFEDNFSLVESEKLQEFSFERYVKRLAVQV